MTATTASNENLRRQYTQHLAGQRAELSTGKITIRWSQACCGYRIRVGRNALLGVDSFISELDAKEWLKERHGIEL